MIEKQCKEERNQLLQIISLHKNKGIARIVLKVELGSSYISKNKIIKQCKQRLIFFIDILKYM